MISVHRFYFSFENPKLILIIRDNYLRFGSFFLIAVRFFWFTFLFIVTQAINMAIAWAFSIVRLKMEISPNVPLLYFFFISFFFFLPLLSTCIFKISRSWEKFILYDSQKILSQKFYGWIDFLWCYMWFPILKTFKGNCKGRELQQTRKKTSNNQLSASFYISTLKTLL